MALGVNCEWMVEGAKGPENVLISRHINLSAWQAGKYSLERVAGVYAANLQNLLDVLPVIYASGVRFQRLSSSLFPLFDRVPPDCWDNDRNKALMAKIGAYVQQHGIRINTHPAQFVVLNSESADVALKAKLEMDFNGWFFDRMGLPQTPYYNINIHGGKGGRPDELVAAIAKLNDASRKRMTLENDEYTYSVKKLVPISKASGIPIVFDSHHHSLNPDGLTQGEALEAAISTWPAGVKPTTHLSNSFPEYRDEKVTRAKKRIHSDYIDYIPDEQRTAHEAGRIDIEVEARQKNLAVVKLVKDFGMTLAR